VDALVERSFILVLASHCHDVIRSMCDKAILLQEGRIVSTGGVEEVAEAYSRMR